MTFEHEENHGAIEEPKPRSSQTIFLGEKGLRAGWGALGFGVFFVLAAMVAKLVLQWFLPTRGALAGIPFLRESIIECTMMFCVFFATAVMARIEERRWSSYGLSGNKKLKHAVGGAFWGFLSLSLLVGLLYMSHHLSFDPPHGTSLEILRNGIMGLVAMTFVAFFEELLLRGYLQWTVSRGIGFWWAALVLSASFASLHLFNKGESPVGIFAAGAIGLVFCLSLWYTGSLWWAIGFHALWDWGESFFYGTPNSGIASTGCFLTSHPAGSSWISGGATGPEASLFVLPTIVFLFVILRLLFGKNDSWKWEQ